jgi:outer membrane protein TolC
MKKIVLIIIGFAYLKIYAQEAYTLKQAIAFAIENAYSAKNAKSDVVAAKKKVNETTSIGLPQISAEGNFQNFIDIPTQVMPANAFNPLADPSLLIPVQFGTKYNTSATITASQLLFDGSYIVGLQAAKTYKELSEKAAVKNEIEIKELVTQAYFTVLIATENLKVVDSSLISIKKNYSDVQQFYALGFNEEQDVDQLKLTVNNLQNLKNRSQNQVELSYRMLKFQMGYDIDKPIEIADNLNTILLELNAENSLSKELSVQKNADYLLLETQKKLMELNLRKERFGYLPSLAAFFTHQQSAFRNEFNFFENKPWYPSTIWGLKLKIPIFDSGIKMSKTSQAKIDIEKIENQKIQLESSLKLKAYAAQTDFYSALEKYNNEKENILLAEKIYNKTLIKYKEGIASSMELTQAHNQWLTAQGNYISSMYELLNAKNQLDKILNN